MKKQERIRIAVATIGGDVAALQNRIARIAPGISEVAACDSPELLRDATRWDDFDAVLLDWRSGVSGIEAIAAAIKACPLIPVIVVSNEAESALSEHMLRLGVQDYLVKRETNGARLVRAIQHAIERKRLDTRLKTTLGELGQANARLRSLALRDTLTGALNRRAFFAIGTQMLARANRHGRQLALLYCDLDGFKQVNDNLGHAVGDAVLAGFYQRSTKVLRRGDSLARLGGDEFVILLESVTDDGVAIDTARRIRGAVEQPLQVNAHRIALRVSVGIAHYPECPTMESLIACADQAMYVAKKGVGIARYTTDDVAQVHDAE